MADDPKAQQRADAHVRALQAQGVQAQALCTVAGGLNRKAAQLAQLPEPAPNSLILSLDSDVLPASVDVLGLVAALAHDCRIGAVWQPVVPQRYAHTFGDRLAQAVLAGSGHAMPLLAQIDAASAVGKAMLLAPHAVAHAGGWWACAGDLGDDITMSQLLAQAGYRVLALAGAPAQEIRCGQTVVKVMARLSRWLLAVRRQRPCLLAAYPLYLFALIGQLSLAAWAWQQGADRGRVGVLALACVGARVALARVARARSGHPTGIAQAFADVGLAETALLVAWIRALWGDTASWHGRRLRPAGSVKKR